MGERQRDSATDALASERPVSLKKSEESGVGQRRVVRHHEKGFEDVTDALTVEEPLEVRVNEEPIAVVMRTPGHDNELVVGFLHGEGLIRKATDVSSIAYCDGVDDEDAQENVIEVKLLDGLPHDFERRRFPVGSSCGVCGRRAIDDLVRNIVPIRSRVEIDPMQLSRMELQFTEGQRLFARTGGLHAAALFDGGGGLLELREDVGRHNAVDKIIGSSILKGTLPLSDHSLMVSGRVSFEIIEKCVRAGCGLLAAVSAPSTLAVDLARRARLTLVAFLRKGRFTVYSDPTVSYDLG